MILEEIIIGCNTNKNLKGITLCEDKNIASEDHIFMFPIVMFPTSLDD